MDLSPLNRPPDVFAVLEPFRVRIPSDLLYYLAERVGFEPTAPFGVTGFQDQLLKPLGHLSIVRFYFIHKSSCIMVTHPRFERGTP